MWTPIHCFNCPVMWLSLPAIFKQSYCKSLNVSLKLSLMPYSSKIELARMSALNGFNFAKPFTENILAIYISAADDASALRHTAG